MWRSAGASPQLSSALEFLTSDRFAELDWDANGEVTFSEFLFAFMQWVGIEDSEAEATAEEKARAMMTR